MAGARFPPPRLRRGGPRHLLALAAGLAAASATALAAARYAQAPHWGFAGGFASRPRGAGAASAAAASGGVALATKPPASAFSEKPLLQRLVGDTIAAIGFPWRYVTLARVTKQVVAEARQSAGSGSGGGSSAKTLKSFLPMYLKSHVIARTPPEAYRSLLNTSLHVLLESLNGEPYPFEPYHEAVRGPGVDHYAWGNDFFRPMVKYRGSRVEGLGNVAKIKEELAAGMNVVLLANHQTEADPQALSIMLELSGYSELAERCIFMAGHKVTTDPLAVPFSMGRNLLTVFSKKYLDTFGEEEKEEKSARNRATVVELQRLLNESGHIFWVAPSGGRDRRNAESGEFEPAAFDPASVGLFQLLAQKVQRASGAKTVFYPLAMWTHRLLPSPEGASSAIGEARSAARAPVGLEFGEAIDPVALGGRKKFPAAAERIVRELYSHLHSVMVR